MHIGGFAEAAGIYRSKTLQSDISSPFAKIPFENSPLSKINELRGTARQSRISFLAQGDINVATHAAFYGVTGLDSRTVVLLLQRVLPET